jgi:hypothetical protein
VFPHTLTEQAEMHRAELMADAHRQRLLRTVPKRHRPRPFSSFRFARRAMASSSPTVCCS